MNEEEIKQAFDEKRLKAVGVPLYVAYVGDIDREKLVAYLQQALHVSLREGTQQPENGEVVAWEVGWDEVIPMDITNGCGGECGECCACHHEHHDEDHG